jgi:hypothetical protein
MLDEVSQTKEKREYDFAYICIESKKNLNTYNQDRRTGISGQGGKK